MLVGATLDDATNEIVVLCNQTRPGVVKSGVSLLCTYPVVFFYQMGGMAYGNCLHGVGVRHAVLCNVWVTMALFS